jgi:hypothetical protein
VTRWFAPLLFTVYLWISVPFIRPASEWLRERSLLRPFLGVLGGLLAAALAREVRARRLTAARWFAAGLTIATFIAGMQRSGRAPEEKIHWIQMGLLTYLFYRALTTDRAASCHAWTAGALAMAMGCIEEVLQKWVSSRVYDPRDLFFSVAAALLTAMLLYLVDRQPSDAVAR